MYCVKCGVRLETGVKACPLCKTPVWDPDAESRTAAAEKRYPDALPSHHRESTIPLMIALTVLTVLIIGVILAVCFKLYRRLFWGSYAIGGIALFYILVILPGWFRHPIPEIFIPADHAAIALYLLLVCSLTGGSWFLSFAFPVTAIHAVIMTTFVALLRRTEVNTPLLLGIFSIVLAGYTMLIEFFEHITFETPMFLWSLYAVAGFVAIGIFLLIIGLVKPLRDALEKRFFF